MSVAQGSCPSCGAPVAFSIGASVAVVCAYCRATVLRTDVGLEDLGKAAALAAVPSLVEVGDWGTVGGRPFHVLGRVQIDHGAGPWDEFYVALDAGDAWGWLAYSEGFWFATAQVAGGEIPGFEDLRLEGDVSLGAAGTLRVTEVKTGRIVSAEGELPGRYPPGFVRSYADLLGTGDAFATLDYGDLAASPEVFLGRRFEERALLVSEQGPRSVEKVKLGVLRCPSCGGDVPKLTGERAERLGCPYCGAVSDVAGQDLISAQEAARAASPIPIGARGSLDGNDYVVAAHLVRSSWFEGERFSWEECLLFSEGVGFRWLVKDETTWLFAEPLNLAELDLRFLPRAVGWRSRGYPLRNQSEASVDAVTGEVFWKCAVGERVRTSDFASGRSVLSREETPGEVRWSHSEPVPWPVLAEAFGADVGGPGGDFPEPEEDEPSAARPSGVLAMMLLLAIVFVLASVLDDDDDDGARAPGGFGVPVYGGSGWIHGGK